MFFLARMVFWFSLVLLALPLEAGQPADGQPAVSPFQALGAAREAIGDVAGLCERKPDICAVGWSAARTVAARARESGRIAFELMGENAEDAPDTAISTGSVVQP